MSHFDLAKINDKITGSRHFTWREALYLPSVQAVALPTEVQMANIVRQAQALDKIRDYFGRPVTVHCWLRPEAYNKLVGGATRSSHIIGLATDFSIPGVSIEDIKKEIVSKKLYPGRGEWDTTTWIHLDLSGTTWFYGRKQPV